MRHVTSREYKLTLNVDDKLYQDWKSFNFEHLQKIIEWTGKQSKVHVSGKFKPLEQFTVKYMDTPNQDLYKNGWIFRIRKYPDPPHEYTLKFRSPDRYYSATKDLHFRGDKTVKIVKKFEEDITLDPFSSNFSLSTNVFSPNEIDFRLFKNLMSRWNGISELCVDNNAPIVSVGGKKVIQEVWKGVNLQLGQHIVKMKVVLWWKNKTKTKKNLLFGEIMFRIKNEKEKFEENCIIDAHRFYLKLNTLGLNTGWINPSGMTKTRYFYAK